MKAKREQMNEGAISHKDCLEIIMQEIYIIQARRKRKSILL